MCHAFKVDYNITLHYIIWFHSIIIDITSQVTELSFTSIINYDASPGSSDRLHLNISWSSPQNIYCPISSYIIYWKITNSTFQSETQTTETFISFNSSNSNEWLKPSCNYSFSITPNTQAGFGEIITRNIAIINDGNKYITQSPMHCMTVLHNDRTF